MPKNKGKGGKNRRRGKNDNEGDKRELVFKEEGQEYAQVLKMLGNNRLEAYCFDGQKRLCHIRGKMRRRVWIGQGDIILVGLREFQDEKADVILKYMADEARNLKVRGSAAGSPALPPTTTCRCTGSSRTRLRSTKPIPSVKTASSATTSSSMTSRLLSVLRTDRNFRCIGGGKDGRRSNGVEVFFAVDGSFVRLRRGVVSQGASSRELLQVGSESPIRRRGEDRKEARCVRTI